MKLNVGSATDLAKIAKAVAPAADRTGAIPALACIRLSATEGSLEVLASDHEHASCASTLAAVEVEGVAVVPAQPLVKVLSSMSGPVTLEVEDQFLVFTAKRGEAALQTVDASAYPQLSAPEAEWVPMGESWGMVGRILHMGRIANMPRYQSVTFDGTGGAWASSGYGLAGVAVPEALKVGIVPISAFDLALGALGSEVDMAIDPRRVYFRGEGGWVSATLLLGDPHLGKWEGQLLASPASTLSLSSAELIDAIGFATAVEDPNATAVRAVRLSMDEGALLVARSVADMGQASTVIDVFDSDWDGVCSINPERLVNAVKALDSEAVTLGFSTDGSRLSVSAEGVALRQVVLPFRR